MKRILVLGNSHTENLRAAAAQAEGLDVQCDVRWVKLKADARFGDLTLDDAFAALKALSADDVAVLSLFGTSHNVIGLLNHPRPYGIMEPGDPIENLGSAELIPHAALRSEIRAKLTQTATLSGLVEAAPCPVFHLAPPPPKADLSFVNKKSNYRGVDIAEAGFAPAQQRLKFWRLEQHVLDEVMTSLGGAAIAPPSEALTDEGFLAEPFHANDATHANLAYGKLVLEQLIAAAKITPEQVTAQ